MYLLPQDYGRTISILDVREDTNVKGGWGPPGFRGGQVQRWEEDIGWLLREEVSRVGNVEFIGCS